MPRLTMAVVTRAICLYGQTILVRRCRPLGHRRRDENEDRHSPGGLRAIMRLQENLESGCSMLPVKANKPKLLPAAQVLV